MKFEIIQNTWRVTKDDRDNAAWKLKQEVLWLSSPTICKKCKIKVFMIVYIFQYSN